MASENFKDLTLRTFDESKMAQAMREKKAGPDDRLNPWDAAAAAAFLAVCGTVAIQPNRTQEEVEDALKVAAIKSLQSYFRRYLGPDGTAVFFVVRGLLGVERRVWAARSFRSSMKTYEFKYQLRVGRNMIKEYRFSPASVVLDMPDFPTITEFRFIPPYFDISGAADRRPRRYELTGDIYNTYRASAISYADCKDAKKEDAEVILDHFRAHIADGDNAIYVRLLMQLAVMVQFPGWKVPPLGLMGKGGGGKSAVFNIMRAILGDWNCKTVAPAALTKQFTSSFEECQLSTMEESSFPGDKGANNRFKTIATEQIGASESKGVDQNSRALFTTSIIISTNDPWLIAVEDVNRRVFAVMVNNAMHGVLLSLSSQEADAVKEKFTAPETIRAFAKILYEIDVDNFNPWHAIPTTKTINAQRMLSLDWFQKWYCDVLHVGENWEKMSVRTGKDIWDEIARRQDSKHHTHVEATKRFGELGIRYIRNRVDDVQAYRYEFPPLEQCQTDAVKIWNLAPNAFTVADGEDVTTKATQTLKDQAAAIDAHGTDAEVKQAIEMH